jgi:sterol desaturase/sphingolipid hydroxylase (fatty acid hydroxylase superfamily)
MAEVILSNEPITRLFSFLAVFTLMALWEVVAQRRQPVVSRRVRWPRNLGILALNTLLLRLIFPAAGVGIALVAEERGWGLLNNISMPLWGAVIVSIILLDLTIYLQHVVFHALPALWRLHRMHHTDLEFDVTTGGRFHPLEILLSMCIKLVIVASLGPPALAVLLFEVLLNATSTFNHANVRIPWKIDLGLRWIVVTPDMHRVHHSALARETNSNFGFNLPYWDRFLGTYRAQPEAGHASMTIGLEQFRDVTELQLGRMLTQPFRGHAGTYTINL